MPNVTLKDAHYMHYMVKGHLIPEEWKDSDIVEMYDGYFKRMWGNTERHEYCRERFEETWYEFESKDEEKILVRGYD